MSAYTVHDLLAGAYRGGRRSLSHTLSHASVDGGQTPLCLKLRPLSLCDDMCAPEPEHLTCERCAHIVAKRGMTRTSYAEALNVGQ